MVHKAALIWQLFVTEESKSGQIMEHEAGYEKR